MPGGDVSADKNIALFAAIRVREHEGCEAGTLTAKATGSQDHRTTGKVDLTGQLSAHRNVTDNCPFLKDGIRPRAREEDECSGRRKHLCARTRSETASASWRSHWSS
ncbi:hypothetical protein GCM10023083_37530 [Streptomyces phyllanthi]